MASTFGSSEDRLQSCVYLVSEGLVPICSTRESFKSQFSTSDVIHRGEGATRYLRHRDRVQLRERMRTLLLPRPSRKTRTPLKIPGQQLQHHRDYPFSQLPPLLQSFRLTLIRSRSRQWRSRHQTPIDEFRQNHFRILYLILVMHRLGSGLHDGHPFVQHARLDHKLSVTPRDS